ncbi:MAG TPA: UDP-3-O-acyl-N-acetylglucosamine deacetylase [Pirellulales bacterium]|nr:UDP-3-O-acyl-N-acetylglucosamine deacetylase [Pirellulales bacterium]
MYALRKQRTILAPVEVKGFGLWSGRDVSVEFRPAAVDSGIVFVRRDLPAQPRIAALVGNRVETPRRTTLSAGGGSVEMVEHVLAALAGMRIDNCEVWVDQAEMPGCDGSSQPFVAALETVGTQEQEALRKMLVVRSVTRLGDDESWVEARPSTTLGLSVKFRLDYGRHTSIGRQTLQLAITPDSFRRELAGSRTFMLEEEAQWLISRGMGTRATHQDVLVFAKEGPIDNPLRFRDECVRHKTLDLVGDLALTGCDVVGHIIAHRSGHRLNAELVRALLNEEEVVDTWRKSA